jgi:hypothetical protein
MSQHSKLKHHRDVHCDRDGDRDAKAISVRGAAAVGGNALSELSMRAVTVLSPAAGPGWSWQGSVGLLEPDAVLLLLLIGDAVLLSLVVGGCTGVEVDICR